MNENRKMPLKIEYRKELNDHQLKAVQYFDSSLLVLAGAGSGKTRVITYKIAYMIEKLGYYPHSILAVTFTNKASGEMAERINNLLGENLNLWIKTFHSSAAKILRIYGKDLGIDPNFTIIDQNDQKLLIKNILKEANIDTDKYPPERYVYLINRAKDRLLNVDEAFKEGLTNDKVFYDVYASYQRRLVKENLLDFADLIFRLVKGLKKNSGVLTELKNRFNYILVDEFQDTNYAQYELIKLLALPEGNISVVGDDDQSIYGFRGARVENVINFTKDFKACKIIKLEENYRSYQTILSASSHLINKNKGRLGKTLFTNKGEGYKITFHVAPTDYYEANFIASEIMKLMSTYGYGYSDFAVFFRTNAQSRIFESVFSNYRIPYTVVGGFKFYEREEIKDIISYIKLALNPSEEVSLMRIYNKPPRGIGEKSLNEIIKHTIAANGSLYRGVDDINVPASRKKMVKHFIDMIKNIGETAKTLSPPELLRYVYRETGYLDWLEETGKNDKIQNLEELYNAVEEFFISSPEGTIQNFIEEISLDTGARSEDFEKGTVYLITLHNAKGLEFPVVFMAGMEDGLFPHFLAEEDNDIQEERRLCYVGMTRAMERLYLSAAETRKIYGRVIQHKTSRFIEELPKNLIIFTRRDYGYNGDLFSSDRSGYVKTGSFGSTNSRSGSNRNVKGNNNQNTLKDFDISEGERVVHKNFGSGEVIKKLGEIITIKFDDGKRMKFMLKYTPLTREKP